jgi:hypothetical protein
MEIIILEIILKSNNRMLKYEFIKGINEKTGSMF